MAQQQGAASASPMAAAPAATSSKAPASGTAQWYMQHKHEPIEPGVDMTLFQAACTFLRLQRAGEITRAPAGDA